jgi:integrase/recombinase XerD
MSRANTIYDFERKIKNELRSVKKDRVNGAVIIKYHWQRIADGISLARQHKCLCTLKQLSKMLRMKFEYATKNDLVRMVAKLEQRDVSLWTKRDYKVVLKTFYQWLYGFERGQHPQIVKWIRAGNHIPNGLKKADLLTSEEINKLARAATNRRDKALILVLAESGRRLGEILTLRIGDVIFDRLGARFFVEGKMGQDYARVIRSARALSAWLKIHPARQESDAPLWIRLDSDVVQQMTYASARAMLQHCIKRCALPKRVWFYLFRHSRGTFASTRLNAQQLCAVMGWRQGSKMPSVYVHLAAEDVDTAQAILNGIRPRNSHHYRIS